MASILDLNPEMRGRIAQATAGGDENSGPYKFNPADFNLVNGQYIPKDEKAFKSAIGLRPNEKFQPIKAYQIQQQGNDNVSTEPYNFQSKYGVEPQNFTSAPEKISGQNSREEWLKAYESMKNTSELPRAYSTKYVKSGINIEPSLGSNDQNERYLTLNPIGKNVLSPLSQRLFEYKNSDVLLERLAGSHYNKEIDIDKWTADPAYREEFTKKYLSENPDLSKKMLQELRGNIPTSIVSQNPDSVGSAGHHGGFNKININPIFHGRNFAFQQDFSY